MKNFRKVSVCILTSAAVLSNCAIVNAESHATVIDLMNGLKNCILTEPDDRSYNYRDYDINKNNNVNVLDMCRLKKSVLDNSESDISIDSGTTVTTSVSETTSQHQNEKVKFELADAEINADKGIVKVPIMLKNNTIGISAFQMNMKYNNNYFTLQKVSLGDFEGSWSVSRDKRSIQFSEQNAHNITSDGIIGYAQFSVLPDTPSGYYQFSLSEIEASTLPEGEVQRMLTDKECYLFSDTYSMNFPGSGVVTTKPSYTTIPDSTTVKITTTPPQTTTTKATTTDPGHEFEQVCFEIGKDIKVSSDNKFITLPIEVKNNTIGISACQMDINYSLRYFNLVKVYTGDFDGSWSKSRSGSAIQFSEANAHNITENGVIGYIKFEVTPGTPAGAYEFSLSAIQASTLPEGAVQRQLTGDECKDKSGDFVFTFNGLSDITTTTTVTTTPKQTTTTVTTTPKQTTTTVTTTPKQTTTTVTTTPKQTTTQITTIADMPDPSDIEIKRSILELVNQKRAENQLDPVVLDTTLSYVADIRASELSELFDTIRPDGSSYKTLMRQYGVEGIANCQYIMAGNTSASGILSSMLKKGAFLDEDFNKMGIGYYYDGETYFDIIFTS